MRDDELNPRAAQPKTVEAQASASWEARLRGALADTRADEPRPMVDLEFDSKIMDKLVMPSWFKLLKPAAVLVPVVAREDGPTMLLTRRSENLRQHKGQISFPGGRRDEGDTSAIDNALRESEEEIGLDRRHVEVIGFLDDYPTGTLYRVTPVVGLIRNLPELRADIAEVAEVFEVPLNLLLDPASYARKSFLRDSIQIPFFEVQYGEYRIWGATAGMLWNLCQKVSA
jgi:8-oxo-dGTP pyrophosphatase MutT (NUDIX family)